MLITNKNNSNFEFCDEYFQYLIDNNIQFDEEDFREFMAYEVDRKTEDMRRWTQWVNVICQLGDKYYIFGYDEGLTEMQEDIFDDSTNPIEVEPYEEVIVIKNWRPVIKEEK